MQVQLNLPFEQLIKIVKALPKGQLKQLKAEIEKESKRNLNNLEILLLNGPTATEKEVEQININRQSINQWRTKKF